MKVVQSPNFFKCIIRKVYICRVNCAVSRKKHLPLIIEFFLLPDSGRRQCRRGSSLRQPAQLRMLQRLRTGRLDQVRLGFVKLGEVKLG